MSIESLIRLESVSFEYRIRTSLFSITNHQVLNNISLEIFKGENIGVLGSNGSGKSTLLKILSGVFQPCSGQVVKAPGLTISLLGLQIGFDVELSGLDNAVFRSMVLGASYQEAKELIGEIEVFCELGDYFRRPVKTYSSGMLARLGFAISNAMSPTLLLIDEVLGVGDMRFREKAEKAIMGKANSNQALLIVSHSIPQLSKLCDKILWLKDGDIHMAGPANEVATAYQLANSPNRKKK